MASKRWATREEAQAFFAGDEAGLAVFDWVDTAIGEGAELRVAPTQIGWARRRGFAFLWTARRWQGQGAAPWVLTVALPERDASPRWKEVVEVRPGLYNHHLEIRSGEELDEAVRSWLHAAYDAAE